MKLVKQCKPDIIFLGVDSFNQCENKWFDSAITELQCYGKVAILTSKKSARIVTWAITKHINGFLLQSIEPDELILAIQMMMANWILFPECVWPTHGAIEVVMNKYEKLTQREKRVVDLLLKDNYRKEVAEILNISTSTVNKHVNSILRKYEVSSVRELKVLIREQY